MELKINEKFEVTKPDTSMLTSTQIRSELASFRKEIKNINEIKKTYKKDLLDKFESLWQENTSNVEEKCLEIEEELKQDLSDKIAEELKEAKKLASDEFKIALKNSNINDKVFIKDYKKVFINDFLNNNKKYAINEMVEAYTSYMIESTQEEVIEEVETEEVVEVQPTYKCFSVELNEEFTDRDILQKLRKDFNVKKITFHK